MKRKHTTNLALIFCLVLGSLTFASDTHDDIASYKACKYCGMNRETYNYSRMLIEYDDGTQAAFCSLHCAAVDLSTHIDKIPKAIKVGDFKGRQLIDAEKAFWVVGGAKPGVMSRRGKWAFENRSDAEDFVKTNHGKMAAFEEAMQMAYEDMYEDTKAIRERRMQKRK